MNTNHPKPYDNTSGDGDGYGRAHDSPKSQDLGAILADLQQPPENPPSAEDSSRTGRRLMIFAGVIALSLAIGFFVVHHLRANQEAALEAAALAAADAPAEVDVVGVQYAPDVQTLVQPGETHAWYYTTIYARTSGYVASWAADIGDRVKKGQVLATIDTPELDDQLAAARAKLKASDAEVKVAEADANFAKQAAAIYDAPKGVVSDLEREEKKAEYDSSVAKLIAAQAQVNLDQADVDRLTDLTAFKQVVLPFDGVVTARHIDIGDLVTAGSTTSTTSLYTVAQINRIRVFVDVPEQASGELEVGTPAEITAPELNGHILHDVVARTANAIDPVTKELRVEVDIPNTDLTIKPGLYVQVAFQVKQSALFRVPASALLYRSGGPQIAVIGGDDKVSFHNVSISSDLGDVVDLGSGVSVADRVALNLSDSVADGDRVTPNRVDTEKIADGLPPSTPPQAVAALAGQGH